jgi:NAD(P)-dependent dehydrogenase (short-subunit alcohol dehydrogenase family)
MSAHASSPVRLKNKVCVITGAASPLAGAVADRLTSEGATVVGVDIREHNVGAHGRQADLTDASPTRPESCSSHATWAYTSGAAACGSTR